MIWRPGTHAIAASNREVERAARNCFAGSLRGDVRNVNEMVSE